MLTEPMPIHVHVIIEMVVNVGERKSQIFILFFYGVYEWPLCIERKVEA